MAYIEREKARELIINFGKGAIEDGMKTLDPVDDIILLSRGVDLIPTADVVEVRHGYWYITEYEFINCSECGHMHYTGMDSTDQAKQNLIDGEVPNYCPNCGAKMDGKDGE